MPITRQFLDWSRPALPQVVERLCGRAPSDGGLDLSEWLLVVPGGRAGRRLLELLTERTGGRVFPPEVITPDQLPEQLYERQRPFACPLTQELAWAEVLSSLPNASLEVLLTRAPTEGQMDRWLELGRLLSRHHTELAADGLDFGDVAAAGHQLPGFEEHDRWTVLRDVQERYLALLDRLGLWDRQTARLFAIRQRECQTDKRILLLAAADLPRAHRQMLDQVEDQVTALIHAPRELADHFDSHGCLVPEKWRDVRIDLRPEQVRVVDGPADQAAEAAHVLSGLGDRYRVDQVTLGLGDDQLIPHLRRILGDCGLQTRPVKEKALHQTAPAQLLLVVADYLLDDRAEHFAALLRHPDVDAWLHARDCHPGWLVELDEYLTGHLQPRLGEWLGAEQDTASLRPVYELVQSWLAPFRAADRQPLKEWSAPITELLLELYRHVEFDEESPPQRITLAACRKLQSALDAQAHIPESLGGAFTAAEAIRLALDAVEGEIIPPPPDAAALPLLGWLELPLDDAPVAVVTTVNDGFIPQSLNADPFLPNSLRTRLGLLDNSRRYARDAYALSALLHSREQVVLIVGRRTAVGDPLAPSRLLFAAEPDVIAQRIVQFYGAREGAAAPTRPPLPSRLTTRRDTPAFFIPRPQRIEADAPLKVVNVTAFRQYIACPYRYYLRQELELRSATDDAEELSGADFGNLSHDVLKAFGRSALKESTDSNEIRDFLDDRLDYEARRVLGRRRRPAVELQVEQLRQRLHAFAEQQAFRRDLGWSIRFIETPNDNATVPFVLDDGRSIALKGRIDRIDHHPERGWMIIDYKTDREGKSPDEVHRDKSGWLDLQLPLYRHLARPLGVEGRVELAFCLLPDNSSRTRFEVAEWTAEELASADELARRVAGRILDQQFWPPSSSLKYDDWSSICQATAFDGEVIEEVAT